MIETAVRRMAPRGERVVRRYGADCEKRYVEVLGLPLPTPLANKFERHLKSKTRTGRLIIALETQESQ